jgi:hypothetical protein
LLLNGVSQGLRNNDGNAVLLWKDVKLAPGDNQVRATARRDGQPLADNCVWTLKTP